MGDRDGGYLASESSDRLCVRVGGASAGRAWIAPSNHMPSWNGGRHLGAGHQRMAVIVGRLRDHHRPVRVDDQAGLGEDGHRHDQFVAEERLSPGPSPGGIVEEVERENGMSPVDLDAKRTGVGDRAAACPVGQEDQRVRPSRNAFPGVTAYRSSPALQIRSMACQNGKGRAALALISRALSALI